jgi:methylated-DNA-[protein]-cysteine S-methyltransferase
VPLLLSSLKTPVGTLNLLADEQILIAANFSTVSKLGSPGDTKTVKTIPIITDLISDYFDGDLDALNGIRVRQDGAGFSQSAWKAMRKVKAGKTLSYADLADRAGSPAASTLASAATTPRKNARAYWSSVTGATVCSPMSNARRRRGAAAGTKRKATPPIG